MPCYHPLVGIWKGEHNEDTGKRKYHIQGNINPNEVKIMYPGSVTIPCGKCIGCKIDYSRAWADRMMLELDSYKGKAVFITMTYKNENVPICFNENDEFTGLTLDKRDVQLFMKRLRKHFSDKVLRFYLSGEYGPTTLRPHYHAIVFGIGLEDLEPDGMKGLKCKGFNELGQQYFISKTLERIWSNGFCLVCHVSWKTCAYVSRYVTKKLGKELEFVSPGAQQEFSLMSRRPGLGGLYLQEHPDCMEYQNINLSAPDGNIQMRIPKYYLKKLKLQNEEAYDKIMAERRLFADDAMYLKLQRTSLSYLDLLELEEVQKIEQTNCLSRRGIERSSLNLY